MQTPARAVAWLALGAALLLAGCASTLTAKVTRFNQWPSDAAGASYHFTAPDPQRDLELQAYQGQVAAELQQLGLRPAAAGETPRFMVDVRADLSEQQRQRLVPVYSDQWVYVPPWRDAQGRLFGGHWVPDPMGSRYVGDRTVTQTVQRSQLQLRISESGRDNASRMVFEATAVHEGREDDLVEVVPYLVRGTFQDFPGANGQVRRLSFDLPRR
jgi:hypothetical protein